MNPNVDKPPCLQLISGDDEYRVIEAGHRAADTLVAPQDQTFGLEQIDGKAETVDGGCVILRRCIEGLQTIGFLGSRKVVWLRDCNLFFDSAVGKSDSIKILVDQLAEQVRTGLPDGHTLLVTAPKVDKRYAFYKLAKKIGEIQTFQIPEKTYQAEKHARSVLADVAQDLKLQFSGQQKDAFLDRSGYDTRAIMNEIEKLSIFLGDRRDVTDEDIENLVCRSRERLAWDLADAVGKREMPGALATLRQLLFQGVSSMWLIAVLHGRFRELLVLREAIDQGWARLQRAGRNSKLVWTDLPPQIALQMEDLGSDPRKLHPFRASKLAEQAGLFRLWELQWCQRSILATHNRLVTSSMPGAVIMELLVVNLIRKKGAGRARSTA